MTAEHLDPLQRAQLLLTVLDEGRRTTTYKLGVLLALLDCCVVGTDARGTPPDTISTRMLAERVLELYWRQVRDRADLADRPYFAQSSQPRAITVEAVRALWTLARAHGITTAAGAAAALPYEYASALDDIELNLVQMPLGKLQRPAGFSETGACDYPRFLYDDAPFHERVTAKQLKDRRLEVVLNEGVSTWLVGLGGLLRPLIELHWARAVARFNRQTLAEDGLRDFLFGSERSGLAAVRDGLRELQDGCCFYCGDPLRAGAVQVDHFVPWSRLPNDALGNLVLADSRCNNSKRDHFADVPLLERWATRSPEGLDQVARAREWPLQLERSVGYARGLYVQLPEVQQVWVAPGVFRVLDRDELFATLGRLSG